MKSEVIKRFEKLVVDEIFAIDLKYMIVRNLIKKRSSQVGKKECQIKIYYKSLINKKIQFCLRIKKTRKVCVKAALYKN